MTSRTQQAFMILLSSVLFGSLGWWLTDGKAKGLLAGVGVGTVAAVAQTNQEKRLKTLQHSHNRLMRQQAHLGRHQSAFTTLDQTAQQEEKIQSVESVVKEYDDRIRQIERRGSSYGQPPLPLKDLDRLEQKLEKLQESIQLHAIDPIQHLKYRLSSPG